MAMCSRGRGGELPEHCSSVFATSSEPSSSGNGAGLRLGVKSLRSRVSTPVPTATPHKDAPWRCLRGGAVLKGSNARIVIPSPRVGRGRAVDKQLGLRSVSPHLPFSALLLTFQSVTLAPGTPELRSGATHRAAHSNGGQAGTKPKDLGSCVLRPPPPCPPP